MVCVSIPGIHVSQAIMAEAFVEKSPDMREETGTSFLPSTLAILNMAGQVKSKRNFVSFLCLK